MRIFYAAGASPNAYDVGESRLWERNLRDTLVAMGHEVIPFDHDVTWHLARYQNYRRSRSEHSLFFEYKSYLQRELLREIAAAHQERKIDLFFSYFWKEICDPATVLQIKSMGIKTVNWFCNASYQFDLVAELAPHYDWCLVPERFRLDDYRAIGARPIYCQEAANPEIYKPYELPKEFDVTFVGQAYGDRPAYIKYLLEKGIDVHVWGPRWHHYCLDAESGSGFRGWRERLHRITRMLRSVPLMKTRSHIRLPVDRIGGILSDQEMVKMFSRSRINLGFSTCGNTHRTGKRITQIRLRDFEIPMSGGFYMVEYVEELKEFFEIGKEIVCYQGPEDLVDKIQYYLRNEEAREQIRKAGYERCLRDHTWRHRFEKVFEEMTLILCAA